MPHLALNTMRLMVGTLGFGLYFAIRREKPAIEHGNIKPVVVYCIVITLASISLYTPVVYLPLSTCDALYICLLLATTLITVGFIDRQKIHWIEVRITT